jgi:hypothetical protein
MELAIALTIWLTFCAFLILPLLGAPPVFARMAIGLCAAELVATVAWATARDQCELRGHCSPGFMDFAAAFAGVQIPVMSAAMLVLALAYGVFAVRNW